MTLEDFKNYFKLVCLAHRDIRDFSVGNDYNQATKSNNYPLAFLEIPYLINYDLTKNYDVMNCALNISYKAGVTDDVDTDHNSISKAKEIGDAIMLYINENSDEFKITEVNGLSFREFTDDATAGLRYEMTIILSRGICNSYDFNLLFDPIDLDTV